MKKPLSLLCILSLPAAPLTRCSDGNGNINAAADGTESTSPTLTEPETTSQQETATPVDVNVVALEGPTAMGMVEFMSQADTGELTDNSYRFSITAATDKVPATLAQETTDLTAVPANLASVLYNNTEGGVQVLAINTLGVLYIIESGDAVHFVEDLRGKTIYANGKGSTPEYALNCVLIQNGVDPASDVTIEQKSEQAECLSILMAEENTITMLPQPFVTTAQTKSEDIRVALDLTEEWDEIQAKSDAPFTLVTGAVVGHTGFVAGHPEAVSALLEHCRASVEYMNANAGEAAQFVGQYETVAAEVAQKTLSEYNIVFVEGVEVEDSLSGYLSVLFKQNPRSVSGALSDDALYYSRWVFMRRPRTIRTWAVLVWFALWQLGTVAIDQQIILVSPLRMLSRLWELIPTPDFWGNIAYSLVRITAGFLLRVAAGTMLATLSTWFRRMEELSASAMLVIKSIPVTSFIILALILFSSQNLAVSISFLIVLPVLYSNALGDIQAADSQLMEMVRVFRIPMGRSIRYVHLPQMMPCFLLACGSALGLCWKSGIVAEIIGIPKGSIGEQLQQAKIYLDTSGLLAQTLVIVLVSLASERTFLALLRRGAKAMERM